MSYSYAAQKSWLFTDEGQRLFLKVRDRAKVLAKTAGAFRGLAPCDEVSGFGDSWNMLACIDRLVEIGEWRRIPRDHYVAAQDEVYVPVDGS